MRAGARATALFRALRQRHEQGLSLFHGGEAVPPLPRLHSAPPAPTDPPPQLRGVVLRGPGSSWQPVGHLTADVVPWPSFARPASPLPLSTWARLHSRLLLPGARHAPSGGAAGSSRTTSMLGARVVADYCPHAPVLLMLRDCAAAHSELLVAALRRAAACSSGVVRRGAIAAQRVQESGRSIGRAAVAIERSAKGPHGSNPVTGLLLIGRNAGYGPRVLHAAGMGLTAAITREEREGSPTPESLLRMVLSSSKGPHRLGVGWLPPEVRAVAASAFRQSVVVGLAYAVWALPGTMLPWLAAFAMVAYATRPNLGSFKAFLHERAPELARTKQEMIDRLRTYVAPYLMSLGSPPEMRDYGLFSVIMVRDYGDYVYVYFGFLSRWILLGWYNAQDDYNFDRLKT